jgi:hypothetical protein
MNYELKVTITNNKTSKFHYQVVDENGNVISERKSNREYVACTIDSTFFFGRLDLIGKGENARFIKDSMERMNRTEEQFLKLYPRNIYSNDYNKEISDMKKRYENYTTIAYKK